MPARRVVIDHLTVGVRDLEQSRRFYRAALAPLGFEEFGPWRDDGREQVDAFYQAALAAGGRDNGAPGERPEYSPGYYGAFVF